MGWNCEIAYSFQNFHLFLLFDNRYSHSTKGVIVPEVGGIQVNFTLDNAFFAWSESEDVGILENLEERYFENFELHDQLHQLATENPNIVMPMANFGTGGRKALTFIIISSKVSFNILLINFCLQE